MSKHIIDKPGTRGDARMTHYTDIEKRARKVGPHMAVETLERRPRPRSETARNRAFLKIELTSD